MPRKGERLDISGVQFGRLTAMNFSHAIGRKSMWRCLCICGAEKAVAVHHLRSGAVVSCGCKRIENTGKLRLGKHEGSYLHHGHARGRNATKELSAYYSAKRRCLDSRRKDYARYGGRGIQFKFRSFNDFLACVGAHPGRGYTLGRIDNEGHYAPGNVRWETYKQQNNNRRPRRRRAA